MYTGNSTTAVTNLQSAGYVEVFPNPVADELTIKMDHSAFSSFTITNSIGQDIMQLPLNSTEAKVNVSALASGVYYITFRGANGTAVHKFVKM